MKVRSLVIPVIVSDPDFGETYVYSVTWRMGTSFPKEYGWKRPATCRIHLGNQLFPGRDLCL